MPIIEFTTPIPTSATQLYAWHLRPGAFERLSPPWQSIEITKPAPVENGSRVELKLRKGPLTFDCAAEHHDVEPGRGFTDVLTALPFARWVHRHDFILSGESAILRDRIDYRLKGGPLGRALAGSSVAHDLATTFAFRHETTARDFARHEPFLTQPRQRIAISGASGLVGGSLAPFLTTGGHQVVRLARRTTDPGDGSSWQPDRGLLDAQALAPIDAVIHLAGENIAGGRWTEERKAWIHRSRVEATRRLIRSLGGMKQPPKTFICASAIGFYGSRGDELLDETSTGGEGFLAEVCRDWEDAAREAATFGMRVVSLRFGVILTPAGGALAKMLPAFKAAIGGRIGDGRQFMSWVSIDDVVGAIHQAILDDRVSGPVNVVAPAAVTNGEFTRTLGKVLHRPAVLPMPAAAARLAFGEMADEMLLSSARVAPRKLNELGFQFDDTNLERTLERLLGKLVMG